MSVYINKERKCDLSPEHFEELTQWIQQNPTTVDYQGVHNHFDQANAVNGLHVTVSRYDPNKKPHATVFLRNDYLRARGTFMTLHWRLTEGSVYLSMPDDDFQYSKKEFEKGKSKEQILYERLYGKKQRAFPNCALGTDPTSQAQNRAGTHRGPKGKYNSKSSQSAQTRHASNAKDAQGFITPYPSKNGSRSGGKLTTFLESPAQRENGARTGHEIKPGKTAWHTLALAEEKGMSSEETTSSEDGYDSQSPPI